MGLMMFVIIVRQVNVSELGLVTPAGKVVWGEFSDLCLMPVVPEVIVF